MEQASSCGVVPTGENFGNICPLLGIGTINDAVTIPTMLVTLLGALILIGIVRLMRRRR